MFCPKCGAQIQDSSLFCESCGSQFALDMQREKCQKAAFDLKNIYKKHVKAPVFLVMAIAFSISAFLTVISFFDGLFDSLFAILMKLITPGISLIFMGLALGGMWKAYAAKDEKTLSNGIRTSAIFDKFNAIMSLISMILVAVFATIAFIILIITTLEVGGSYMILPIITLLFAAGITIAIFAVIMNFYQARARYFTEVSNSVLLGRYTPASCPCVTSYILGGYYAISAISSLATHELLNDIVGNLGNALGSELDFLTDPIKNVLFNASFAMTLSTITSIVSATFFICSAIWMNILHNKAKAATIDFERENNILQDITRRTKIAVDTARFEREAAMKKAEEERMKEEMAAERQKSAEEDEQKQMLERLMKMMQDGNIN